MNIYCISRIDFKIKTINPIENIDIRISVNKRQGRFFFSDVIIFFNSFCLKGIQKSLFKQGLSSVNKIFFTKLFIGPNRKAYIKKKPVTRLDILNKRNNMG